MASLALSSRSSGRWSARSLAIAAAVPDGSQRAGSQAAFVRAVQADEVLAQLREDAYRNLVKVAWVLARHADWTSLCARPTWDLIAERAEVSRSTVARCISRLRERGLLGVVETGSTVATRGYVAAQLNAALPAGHPDRLDGNRAAEYVLCVPRPPMTDGGPPAETQGRPAATPGVDGTDTPSVLLQEHIRIPTRARASQDGENRADRTEPARYPQGQRAGMLATCERLRVEDFTLRRCSARMLRHLLRPLLAAGATTADVWHVLHHAPDGTAWSYTTAPVHVPAWIGWRLSHWLDANGALATQLPSQQAAQRSAAARAALAASRAHHADRHAQASQRQNDHAATARAMLAAANPRSAAMIRARQR